MHYGFYYDPTYLILIPALILSVIAQGMINSAYSKYSRVGTINGYTGADVARRMLNDAGLYDIPIDVVNKTLGDHYDPRSRVLRLSPDVYNNNSIASACIAAHEVGHAIQHNEKYTPLIFRNSIVGIVNFSSNLSWILFFAGIVLAYRPLIIVGIILFTAAVIFQLVTLPVEFNASARALKILRRDSILYDQELASAKKVLRAAAMTYVAAALMSILQLVRLIAISNRNDKR